MMQTFVDSICRRPAVRWAASWGIAAVAWSCSSATSSDLGADGIAAVVVTPSASTLAVGAQLPLQAAVQDADGKLIAGASVVWTVKDAAIASVSSAGVVTGLAIGATQVAANVNGHSGIAAITVQKTPVASLVVRPSHVDAVPGLKTQLTGVAYDAAQNILSDRAIIWSSSNTAIATIDVNGMVTAVAPGTATLTGTAEGKSDVATITVTQAPVASVVVTPNPLSMSVGQTTQLTATTADANGTVVTGRTVAWTSSDSGVAKVSTDGVVTAVSAGSAVITATSEGKSGTATITVSNFPVGSVTVLPSNSAIAPNASTQLSAIVRDVNGAVVTNRAVIWSSSNPQVATVTGSGLVTGVAVGTVTITATSEGKSGTATVTVLSAAVANVAVSPSNVSLAVGSNTGLTATATDANGNVITGAPIAWTTSNPGVATVSSSGLVTAVGAGSATITATSAGKSGTASVSVTANVSVATVTVQPATASVGVGQSTTLIVTVKDANGNVLTGRTVTWTSSNTGTATVSSAGVVTGVAVGAATITATSEGKSGTATVTVTAPVATVTVTPSTASVIVGQTTTLAATTKDASGNVLTGRTITWTTSNALVATVSASGVVTGVAAGTATITATSEGKSGTATVTVTLAPVASITVTPATASVVVGQTTTLSATTKDAAGNVLTGRTITWTSGTNSIATVSSSGVVTGVAAGTVLITATSEGRSASATVTVTQPVPVATVTVTPSDATISVGQTRTLTAVTKDASGNVLTGRVVTWTSSNTQIATVSSTGVVTGVKKSNTPVTITATSEGKSGTASVTVQ